MVGFGISRLYKQGKFSAKGAAAMIRRYGEAPITGKHYRIRHGAYAVLPRGGQVLMTWQGGIHNEVQLPGGGIDPGESPIAALHREVFEETGWHISRPRKLGVFRRFAYMPDYDKWAEKICHIFLARPTICMGPPSEAEHTPIWMTKDIAIRELYNVGDAAFVARLL